MVTLGCLSVSLVRTWMNYLLRCCIWLAVSCFVVAGTEGAEITLAKSPSGRPLSGITIEGEIVAGDYHKFRALVLSTKGANPVWLASPGGNFSEALRMGRLIRALSLEVWAPMSQNIQLVRLSSAQNNACASA